MVGWAKSDTRKLQIYRCTHDDLMDCAVSTYQAELTKPYGVKRKGAHAICKDFESVYHLETGKSMKLSYSTLTRLADGGRCKAKANAAKGWLTEEEKHVVVDYIIETGNRGFPLSHKQLKEHVDEICQAHHTKNFPAGGVDKKWTHQFVEKHSDHIKTSWAHTLESKHGCAVNPHTNKAFYTLLGETLEKYDINAENTYMVDEIGIQTGEGRCKHVLGACKAGPQYQQCDGNRENITILITICADSTSILPTVIYKGQGYLVKWEQDNPANAL
jgi:hypothetical protein